MPGNFPTPDFFLSLFVYIFISYTYLFSLLSVISVGTSYIYTSTYLYFTDAQQVAAHAHFLKKNTKCNPILVDHFSLQRWKMAWRQRGTGAYGFFKLQVAPSSLEASFFSVQLRAFMQPGEERGRGSLTLLLRKKQSSLQVFLMKAPP